MDPAWIGTVSALAGAGLAGLISIGRDFLGVRQQKERDAAQRLHEIEERRFDARRDAYVSFAAQCHQTITSTDEFQMEHQGTLPGENGYEGTHHRVLEALDLVRIIGPQEAIDAAVEATAKLDEWAYSLSTTRDDAEAAVGRFTAVSRRLLKLEGA